MTEPCGAVAPFTYFASPVVCTKPRGHEGDHFMVCQGPMPVAWGVNAPSGEIGPAVEADLRARLAPLKEKKA
jgi:hypothetical protein